MGKPIRKDSRRGVTMFALPNKEESTVVIDTEDYVRLIKGTKHWYIKNENKSKNPKAKDLLYVVRNMNGKTEYLHTVLIDQKRKGYCTDHINRNSLDNRMINLRFVKEIINLRNKSFPASKFNYINLTYKDISLTKFTRNKNNYFQSYEGKKYIGSSKCIEMLKTKIDKYLEGKK